MSRAIDDVVAERMRQIMVEGWTIAHDDVHADGEMAFAAACYALAGAMNTEGEGVPHSLFTQWWPWDRSWWKPGYLRRNLVKAGALILAEIERLDRAESAR